MRTFTATLPCKLTSAEKETRGHELVECMREKARIEAEKSLAMDGFKSRLKTNESRSTKLAQAFESGVEYRQVPCSIRFDFERNLVETVRLDTGEVSARPMLPEERQTQINFAGAPDEGEEDGTGDDDDLNDDASDSAH